MVESAGKGRLSEEQRTRTVALLAAHQRRVWEAFPGGSGGATQEERAARLGRARRAREALEGELRVLLPSEVADDVLRLVPQIGAPLGPDLIAPPMGDGK